MAEVEFYVELLFEEVGTAFGIAKIFGDIAASVDFEGDRTALEGSAHGLDALAMRVFEALGNANERGSRVQPVAWRQSGPTEAARSAASAADC